MATGRRIRLMRTFRGFTQKELGEAIGFTGRTSDVRIAQYENETRVPKQDLVNKMAGVMNVSPLALTVPDIDSYLGIMHTLFTLEDTFDLEIKNINGTVCMTFNNHDLESRLRDWQKESEKLKNEEITKEEYDNWRYTYPEIPAQSTRNSLDALAKELKNK